VAVLLNPLRRLVILGVLIAALALVGCGAVAQFQTPCPGYRSVSEPTWSPDGTKLAYILGDMNGIYGLYVTDLIRDTTTRITDASEYSVPPEWSPTSNRLIHVDGEWLIVDLNGTRETLHYPLKGAAFFQWSPVDNKFAVVYFGTEGVVDFLIFQQDAEIEWTFSERYPNNVTVYKVEWSQDGKQIALALGTGFPNTLAVVQSSGESLQTVTQVEQGAVIEAAQWSPDGSQIAFSSLSGDPATQSLSVIRPDGTNLAVLANDLYIAAFQWLPDSSGIIYLSDYYEIVSTDGTTRSVLSTLPTTRNVRPFFAPDASRIAYVSAGVNGSDDIYVMNIDGTNVQQITHNPGNTMCFNWPF
jgi:Tol biopolymer transport system component